jgi:hypothetical protein
MVDVDIVLDNALVLKSGEEKLVSGVKQIILVDSKLEIRSTWEEKWVLSKESSDQNSGLGH